ncbi:MAG: GtrA family protein [Sphingobacteriaceae bacterium]
MRSFLLQIIDFFHKPVAKWIPKATFRYAITGGGTAAMGILIYFVTYNFILKQQPIVLPFITISGPISALIIELSITFPLGFLLNKYLVFTQSDLRGRVQLLRYGSIVGLNIFLNYVLIKLMVEVLAFYPTIAKTITTVLLAIFSYFSQKNYTFKVSESAKGTK